MAWTKNITNIEDGVFRSMNGNADEMIAIGRVIKAGFPCSKVDVTNAKYDAIVDLGGQKRLLRIQVKGTGTGSVNFTGGYRSGKQFDKDALKNQENRTYKYTKDDCDLILAIDGNDGDCYIIPVEDIGQWGNSKSLSKLQKYKENWDLLIKLANAYLSI